MPFGPFGSWEECMTHMQDKQGYDEETAKKVCGRMKADLEVASAAVAEMHEANDRLFLSGYLIDTSVNKNKWGVKDREHLLRHVYRFAGKPIVITPDLHHPKLQGMTLMEALTTQEKMRIGNILNVRPVVKVGEAGYNEDRFKIDYEITHPVVKKLWRERKLPPYLSPAIAKFNKDEQDGEITDFEPLHVAIVRNPAFGFNKSVVTGDCYGDAETCMAQIRMAAVEPPSDCLPCGKKIIEIGNEYFQEHFGDILTQVKVGSSQSEREQNKDSVDNLAEPDKDTTSKEGNDSNHQQSTSAASQNDIDHAAQIKVLQAELAKTNEKLGVVTKKLETETNARVQAEKTLKDQEVATRTNEIAQIVTADVEPDEEKRNKRIETLVASTWSLDEIKDIFAPVREAIEVRQAALERRGGNTQSKEGTGSKAPDYKAKLQIREAAVNQNQSSNNLDSRPSWLRVRDTVIRPSQSNGGYY